MEVVEKRMIQRELVISEVKKFAANLKFKCSVLLIGSYACGDFNLWSDVDLLMIEDFPVLLSRD